MGIVQAQRYCPTCNRLVLANKRTPNHILHLLLTVLLLGAWAIVWLIVALTSNKPYLCTTCGSVTYPPNQSAQPTR
jgi:hypothetical protein